MLLLFSGQRAVASFYPVGTRKSRLNRYCKPRPASEHSNTIVQCRSIGFAAGHCCCCCRFQVGGVLKRRAGESRRIWSGSLAICVRPPVQAPAFTCKRQGSCHWNKSTIFLSSRWTCHHLHRLLSCAKQVREGDVVTVRGKGRVEIEDITVTKKGRYKINMCRNT